MIDENLLLEIVNQQGWSFPLKHPLVLDSKGFEDWGKFQSYLRVTQYINQNGKCLCGCALGDLYELHHALISRKDFDSPLIHSSFNVLCLHRSCHIEANRHNCMTLLAEIFGFDMIYDWYYWVKEQMKGGFRNLEMGT